MVILPKKIILTDDKTAICIFGNVCCWDYVKGLKLENIFNFGLEKIKNYVF